MLTKHVPYNHQNIIPHMIFFVSHMFGTLISHIKTHKKGNSVRNNHQKWDVHPNMGLIHFSPANCCCYLYDDQPNHGHLSATRKFGNATSFDKGSQPAMFDCRRVSQKRPCWLQR